MGVPGEVYISLGIARHKMARAQIGRPSWPLTNWSTSPSPPVFTRIVQIICSSLRLVQESNNHIKSVVLGQRVEAWKCKLIYHVLVALTSYTYNFEVRRVYENKQAKLFFLVPTLFILIPVAF